MNVRPSATYEAIVDTGTTGLTGTLKLGVYDNQGNVTSALSTSGIIETPSGSGVYAATRTAPAAAGQYTLVWSLDGTTSPGQVVVDELVVSTAITGAVGDESSTVYVTADELKATLNIGSTYADDDIQVAVEAASRCCDGYKGTRFWATTETRYYTGCPGEYSLDLDEINTFSTVEVDLGGDHVYETTWTEGTDFFGDPVNGPLDGRPYNRLCLYPQRGRRFPYYENSVKVTGSFGWATVPAGVKQATTILAGRFLKRARETPYGLVVVTGDAVAAARLGRIDPDVAFILDELPGTAPLLAV